MIGMKINLTKLLDVVRKDSGISNAIGAMEQLSLLILLKYFHRVVFVDASDCKYSVSFKEFILESNVINDGVIKANFFKLDVVLGDLAFTSRKRLVGFHGGSIVPKVYPRIYELIEAIPFRIRSIKILEILLSQLETIEFDDTLADAYDDLVIKMVGDSIASGAFHSPKALVSAIVNVVKPAPLKSIYDPALGIGGFLIESKKFIVKAQGNEFNDQLCMFGRDISPTACLMGSLNLLLNGIDVGNISMGDSLLDDGDLTYDIILSGIPFGKAEGVEKYKQEYLEYSSGLDAMFLNLAMKKLAHGGKAALIVPECLLFNRSNDLVNLRRKLLTRFNLHSILKLSAGVMAPFSGVQASVLFFDKNEPSDDIWFYKLNSDKSFSKNNLVGEIDFSDFCELFSKRSETKNSNLINKRDILSRDSCGLSFELSLGDDKKNEYRILDELLGLMEKKKAIDELWSNLTESLMQPQEAGSTKKTTLGDLVTLSAGKMLGKTSIGDEGEYPVYGGNGIIGYYDQCNRVGENIVIGRVGANCGNVHIVNAPIWITDNSFSVQIKSSVAVYLPYLAHALRSMDLKKLARGSAQPSISNATIKDIEINLPSYDKQMQLSKWFDEIKVNNDELQKIIQLQRDKFDELANFSIASNCVGAASN